MQIHVSIHDVSPAFETEVEEALTWCHKVGVNPALLVVPDFHQNWPLQEFPAYIERLQDLSQDGHEIYLHGYYHRSDPPQNQASRSRLKWLFQQKVVSAGEAEFGALSKLEAKSRLQRGVDLFQACGLPIDGFVAPAWTMPKWFLPMLSAHEIRYSEDHFHIYNPQQNTKKASLVLNWASRSWSRMASTVVFCRAAKHGAHLFPTRIAIHPKDLRVARLRHEIQRLLAWGQGHYIKQF